MKIEIDESTRSKRKKWSWTNRNLRRNKDVLSIINELREFWPLTIRQIFYRFITAGLQRAKQWVWGGKQINIYPALSRHIKWMRIDEIISWDTITDEHRTVSYRERYRNAREYLEAEKGYFLTGYDRCLAQKQKRHIEIWLEKNTLRHILEPIANKYCRRLVICRGYDSFTFQTEFYLRATEAISRGQIPTVLYFGDWDPSGENMIYAAAQTLQEELGLEGVEYYRVGINPEHFGMIPSDPIPIKPKDARAKNFIKKYGPTAYELDAFHPKQLQEMVEAAIQEFSDLDTIVAEYQKGREERERLEAIRGRLIETIDREIEKFEQV